MKKLILASMAVAATLASCQKAELVDPTITTNNQEIKFAPYAGASSTRGTAVNTNDAFQGKSESYKSFMVAANFQSTDAGNSGNYFNFTTVTYNGSSWAPETDKKMYWPNEAGTLYFGAYYPSTATFATDTPTLTYDDTNSKGKLGFGYTVNADEYATGVSTTEGTVSDHIDVMYAFTTRELTEPTSSTPAPAQSRVREELDDTQAAVNLHFKHVFSQIGFTAYKDAGIEVEISEISICNVKDGGVFTANAATDDTYSGDLTPDASVENHWGTWDLTGDGVNVGHYEGALALATGTPAPTTVTVASTTQGIPTQLTDTDDVMMLIPQKLTAWDPDNALSQGDDARTYLAIKCTIKHSANSGADIDASIIDGYVYVPFGTDGLTYSNDMGTDGQWMPGYKYTYNLHFGGGYTTPGEPEKPEPGKEPEDAIKTLRAITYTVSIDEWIPKDGGELNVSEQ